MQNDIKRERKLHHQPAETDYYNIPLYYLCVKMASNLQWVTNRPEIFIFMTALSISDYKIYLSKKNDR